MGKSSGYLLILAGIAVAAYALYPQPQAGPEIAALQSAAGGKDGAVPVREAQKPAAPAHEPAPPAAAPPAQTGAKPAAEPAKSDTLREKSPVPPVPVPARRPRSAVAVVRIDEAPLRLPVGEVKAAAPLLDHAALAREIQRELKRIGCYRGEVTGVWSPSVRQAMQAFTERTNATLPVDKPDPVLLAMVEGHAPGACSATCPSGQARSAAGRCVPSAILASAAAKGGVGARAVEKRAGASKEAQTAPAAPTVAVDRPAAAYRPMDGRMSLAGPPAAEAPKAMPKRARVVPRRAARVTGWSRSAQARSRGWRPRQASGVYSGAPSWALPFLLPY